MCIFLKQIVNITTSSINISKDAQILTYNAGSLTAENISAAANVVGQIFNSSRNATPEVKCTRFGKKDGDDRRKSPTNSVLYSIIWTWVWFRILIFINIFI